MRLVAGGSSRRMSTRRLKRKTQSLQRTLSSPTTRAAKPATRLTPTSPTRRTRTTAQRQTMLRAKAQVGMSSRRGRMRTTGQLLKRGTNRTMKRIEADVPAEDERPKTLDVTLQIKQ